MESQMLHSPVVLNIAKREQLQRLHTLYLLYIRDHNCPCFFNYFYALSITALFLDAFTTDNVNIGDDYILLDWPRYTSIVCHFYCLL